MPLPPRLARRSRSMPHRADRCLATYHKLGFSDAAAAPYARMTAFSIDEGIEAQRAPDRGSTTLQSYIATLVAESEKERDDE